MEYPTLLAVHLPAGSTLENNATWFQVLLESLQPCERKGRDGYLGQRLHSLDATREQGCEAPWLVVCLQGNCVTTLGSGRLIGDRLWLPVIRRHRSRTPIDQFLLPIPLLNA